MQMTEVWQVVDRDGTIVEHAEYEDAKAHMDALVKADQFTGNGYAYQVVRVTKVVFATSSGCAR